VETLPLAVLLKCADREIRFRDAVYPRWVQRLKMTAENASIERIHIRAVRDRLLDAEALQIVLQRFASRMREAGLPAGWEQDVAAMRRELLALHPPPMEAKSAERRRGG
jgi:hypothetical protein